MADETRYTAKLFLRDKPGGRVGEPRLGGVLRIVRDGVSRELPLRSELAYSVPLQALPKPVVDPAIAIPATGKASLLLQDAGQEIDLARCKGALALMVIEATQPEGLPLLRKTTATLYWLDAGQCTEIIEYPSADLAYSAAAIRSGSRDYEYRRQQREARLIQLFWMAAGIIAAALLTFVSLPPTVQVISWIALGIPVLMALVGLGGYLWNCGTSIWVARGFKVPTWALVLLYPLAAWAIWIGLTPPEWKTEDSREWLLTAVGGILIAGASIRLLIQIQGKHRVWLRYILAPLTAVGVVFGFTGNDMRDGWLLTMGDPHRCDDQDRADIKEDLHIYSNVFYDYSSGSEDAGAVRKVAHHLNYYVRRGCVSVADLEKQKYDVEQRPSAGITPVTPPNDQKLLPQPIPPPPAPSVPAVGKGVLSAAELRWCLLETSRLERIDQINDKQKSSPKSVRDERKARHNDWAARCGAKTYLETDRPEAERFVAASAASLDAEARSIVNFWFQEAKLKNPPVTPPWREGETWRVVPPPPLEKTR